MKCPACNNNIRFGEKKCSNCGSEIDFHAIAENRSKSEQNFKAPSSTPSTRPKPTARTSSAPASSRSNISGSAMKATHTVNCSTEALSSYTLDLIRFVRATVSPGYNSEALFAEDIAKRLSQLFKEKRIDALISFDIGQCGSAKHPLVRVSNRDYGAIGLLINKNIVTVIRLIEGTITTKMKEQQRTKQQYEAEAEWNRQKSREAFASGGFIGVIAGFANEGASSKASKKAASVGSTYDYDPSELVFEQAWERDVLKCIDLIGNDELFQ